MAKILAVVNQKGGVGKTTSCVNLVAALNEAGKRVLLCDFDPQANATSGMGVDKTVSKGIYHVVIGEVPAAEAVVHTRFGDVLPSNKALAGAGIELIGMESRNCSAMQRICGGDPDGKMKMLLDYTDRPGSVADPWYTGDFQATWRDVSEGCTALLEELRTEIY